MAAVGLGTTALGGIMKAFGGNSEAEAGAKLHEYKAGVARQNAALNRQNSVWALDTGEQAARRSGMTTGFTIAKQKTAQAASGFDLNSGTPADVRESQAKVGLEDQTSIRTTAGRKALDYRNRAVSSDLEAESELTAAKNTREAGKLNFFSTLLGAAGSVASKWSSASSTFSKVGSGITTYDENFNPVAFTTT